MIVALLGNAITVAILIPLVWLLTRAIRYPAVTHWLWLGLLIKLVLPPTWFVAVVSIDIVPGLRTASEATWPQVLLLSVWSLGAILSIVLMLRRAEIFRRYIAAKSDFHSPAQDLATRADPGGMIFKTPPVALVDAAHSPMLCGAGPFCKILFPRDLWYALPVGGRQSLLAHELGHFRRGDAWVRVLELLTAIVFWWHPGLWIIRHYLEASEEDCCDAIGAGEDPQAYGKAMLTTLDFLADPESFRPLGSSFFVRVKSSIERRLERIFDQPASPFVPMPWRFFLVLYYLLLILFSVQI